MPSVTPTSDTAAGIATITAVAALGNPRTLPGTKTVLLDAQIYVGSPSCESLLGSLRFFNVSDMVFEHQSALYLIYATFARMENGVDQLSITDYNFVATNVNQESGTFKLDVEHYISAFRDLKDSNSKPIKPIAPISCEFSSRYQNRKKPVPFNRRYVSISGFLTDVTYKRNSEDVERFMVSIDHIAFLGQQGNSTAIPNTLDTPFKTPRCGKSLIDYKRGRSTTPITTTIASPTTPVTPTPTQGPPRKRQRVEANQASESDSNSSDIYVPDK
ncbi:hypothetical protein D9615_005621 [Tricholomella constricta]|uniref:Uncharacterized protein n=1 Tax=Tricholomella constricta TaxID=117010 RepID=A0A8H5HED7_9AGAR|nr:hypothetical protein D9615_005621 [Tricholomella constricta]